MPSKPDLASILTAGSTRNKPRSANGRTDAVTEGRGQLLGSHIPEEAKHQFDMLAAEQKKTKENLHAEAINDLFAKYGKPELCPIKERGRKRRRGGQG
jgi:hypothetical protein